MTACRARRLHAVEWWPFTPMWVDGDAYIFSAHGVLESAAGEYVGEYVCATPQAMTQIWELAGPEKGFLKLRTPLMFVLRARLQDPLRAMARFVPESVTETGEDTLVLRGSASTADLLGGDIPKGAIEQSLRAQKDDPFEVALTVDAQTYEPISIEVTHVVQQVQRTTDTFQWARSQAPHAPAPRNCTKLAEWKGVTEVPTD